MSQCPLTVSPTHVHVDILVDFYEKLKKKRYFYQLQPVIHTKRIYNPSMHLVWIRVDEAGKYNIALLFIMRNRFFVGGILDRVDSYIFTGALAYSFVKTLLPLYGVWYQRTNYYDHGPDQRWKFSHHLFFLNPQSRTCGAILNNNYLDQWEWWKKLPATS